MNKKEMIRYSRIEEKNKREIVLLLGRGCTWRKCRFCDYYHDYSPEEADNYQYNQIPLKQVTGIFGKLEVINSGSFVDLDHHTLSAIRKVCKEKEIHQLHFECHYQHRHEVAAFREKFAQHGICLKIKTGVETFDSLFRESYLAKGIDTDDPDELRRYFDEVCLLQGLPGQTEQSMENDIKTGLAYFERVCINIMQENSQPIKPDPRVIALFKQKLYPQYKDHPSVDILLKNTEFGVGGFRDE